MGIRRGRRSGLERAAGAGALALFAASCAAEAVGPAHFDPDACRRVALIDQETGEAIVGAEDLALDAARGRIYVSAYDRRATEKAVRSRAMRLPEGGLYTVSLDALFSGEAEIAAAAPLARAKDVAGGLRPHGLAYDPQADQIVFINRAYQKINGGWRMTPRIERVGPDGAFRSDVSADAHCAANSVAPGANGAIVSFDHGGCGWRGLVEDAFALKRSGVMKEKGEVLFDGALYANGLARLPGGALALAATREDAVIVIEASPDGLVETRRIAVPGGPDNLSVAADGAVFAAVHPSLWRMALERRLGFGNAPSRIVRIDPESGDVGVVYDDPSGEKFSAATGAVAHEGRLVAGSATDAGLLVCQKRG